MTKLDKILNLQDSEEIYSALILLGKNLPKFPVEEKKSENLIHGCQSVMYLYCEEQLGKLYFFCESDALISKGIAAFCIEIVNGKTPKEILECTFSEIQKINLPALLSASRSNGLLSLLKKIKQYGIKYHLSNLNQ